MAYDFVRASSQYLNTSTTPVTTVPMTMVAWARTSNTANAQNILSVSLSTNASLNTFVILEGNTASDQVCAYVNSGAAGSGAISTTAYPTSTWFSAAGVFAASNSRTVYLDAGSSATSTGNFSTTGLDSIWIGVLRYSSINYHFFDGQLAEAAIWNIALTAAEITSLAKGFKPTRVRPQNLVFYAPLIRNIQDTRGGRAITNNNTATVAAHPRVI